MYSTIVALAMLFAAGLEQPPTHTIAPASSLETSVPFFTAHGGAKCDNARNLYFLLDGTGFWDGPVLRLTRKDLEPTLYSPPRVDTPTVFASFDVSRSGEVRLLNQTKDGTYVITFGKNGKPIARTRLQSPENFEPRTFAVSNSGTIFVAGHFNELATDGLGDTTYAATFDSSGALRRRLASESGILFARADRAKPYDLAAAVSDDGTVYFARRGQLAIISSGGELLRTVKVPKPDDKMNVSRVVLDSGRVLVEILDRPADGSIKSSVVVFDEKTGRTIAFHKPDKQLGDNIVCMRGGSYTFLTMKNRKVKVTEANARR